MSTNPAPKFCKTNQHFVPRFWIKRFGNSDGRIFGRRRGEGRAGQVAVGNIMTSDWTYTVFDAWWRPSDVLEDALSEFEGEAAITIAVLHDVSTPLDAALKARLCHMIAVSVCRLPSTMRRNHRRMQELAETCSRIDQYADDAEFIGDVASRFGVPLSAEDCKSLRSRPEGALEATARTVRNLSPQHPLLPEQEALRGVGPISAILETMNFTLHDAPAESLVLGDTPLPDSDMAMGFELPLSHRLLLKAEPGVSCPIFVRTPASPEVINASNRFQFDSLLDIVVGPDKMLLESL